LWRQEQQSRNAQEIAHRGGELYDKLSGFVSEFVKIRTKLDDAANAYDAAFDKLSRGRGNTIRQAEMLRDLGVKPSKQIPQNVISIATNDDAAFDSDSKMPTSLPTINLPRE
jgi:DNA recombination protein RmuC